MSAGAQAGVIQMLPVVPCAKGPAARNRRWGVILAGGDGTRVFVISGGAIWGTPRGS